MPTEDELVPTDALEDVAYFARSANRIRILDALAEEPRTRRELAESTGVSRATLDRIVNELEERGWAERTADGDYAATPTGDHLLRQLHPFVGSVAAVRRLGEAVGWLPIEDLSVGLHHFRDATVRRPQGGDPMDTIDFFVDLIRGTSDFRVLSGLAPPAPLARAMRDRIVAGRLAAEYVVTDDVIEFVRERADRRARWREMIEGGAAVFRRSDPVPCNLYVFDDTVLIKKGGPNPIDDAYGVPIRSEDDAVRSWAHDLFDGCRSDAVRLGSEAFAEGEQSSPPTN